MVIRLLFELLMRNLLFDGKVLVDVCLENEDLGGIDRVVYPVILA